MRLLNNLGHSDFNFRKGFHRKVSLVSPDTYIHGNLSKTPNLPALLIELLFLDCKNRAIYLIFPESRKDKRPISCYKGKKSLRKNANNITVYS